MNKHMKNQKGAVSIFIVIFVVLLVVVITTSFIRIMLRDQTQSSALDLSRSAYDSAQAGVEDAKRALLRYQSICSENFSSQECQNAYNAINSQNCNDSVKTLGGVIVGSDEEVKIQTESNDSKLDQAYTCVKITVNTDDYLGKVLSDQSNVIPLSSVGSFNKIQIEWFNKNNIEEGTNTVSLLKSKTGSDWPLFSNDVWAGRPPIVRTQMILLGENFTLESLDDESSKTLFLYPWAGVSDSLSFSNDIRRNPTSTIVSGVHCLDNLSSGSYACKAVINMPSTVSSDKNSVFLRLRAIYSDMDYKVTLLNNDTQVDFKAVQPEIDSTGRANDYFRRVKTRVEMTDVNFPYPENAVDISGSFCKDFSVTDSEDDYNTIQRFATAGNATELKYCESNPGEAIE